MPVLRGIASPGHLHIHELVCRKNVHNLLVNLRVLLEGLQGEADSLITDGPHDHVFTVIRDWGHRNLQHHLWRVGQERPHCQKLAKLPIALTPLCRGLRSSKVVGIQELLHLLLGLLQVGLVLLGRFSLSPAGTLDHQGHLTPDAVQFLHSPAVAIDMEQSRQGPSLGLPLPIAVLIIGGPKTTTDRLWGWSQAGVHLLLHILLRVEARGEVPIPQVGWVSTGFEGYQLLPFQLLGPLGWI